VSASRVGEDPVEILGYPVAVVKESPRWARWARWVVVQFEFPQTGILGRPVENS
jgi:hypothetical protein